MLLQLLLKPPQKIAGIVQLWQHDGLFPRREENIDGLAGAPEGFHKRPGFFRVNGVVDIHKYNIVLLNEITKLIGKEHELFVEYANRTPGRPEMKKNWLILYPQASWDVMMEIPLLI